MHELGVVFYVVKDVKKVVEENDITKVNSVTIRLGEVSAVVPDLLIDCWNWAVGKEEGALHGAELKVETIEALTYCEDCGQTYSTVKHGKICPNCGSEHTYLTTGNEFIIKDVECE